jgi:cytochrome b561
MTDPADTPKRYHPALVAIHWLMAVLVFLMLAIGNLHLVWLPNDEAKLPQLALHIGTGIFLGLLVIVRFIVRIKTRHPAPATAGNPILDFIGRLTHWLLYLVPLAMVATGMLTSQQANLMEIIGGRMNFPANFDFYSVPQRAIHEYFSYALFGLIGLHVGAALFHQFIRKDNLIGRMWFGKQ